MVCSKHIAPKGMNSHAEVTEKQRIAMESSNVPFVFHSIHELVYNCVKNLLKGKRE